MENPNSSENAIIGNCLSCQSLVRVPARAPANSKVRCPHCTQSFLLSQILDQAIPELELVDDSTDSPIIQTDLLVVSNGASKDEEGRFVVAPQLRSKPRSKKRRRSSRENGESRSGRSKSRSSSSREAERVNSFSDSSSASNAQPTDGQFSISESESERGSRSQSRSSSRSRDSERSSRERSSRRRNNAGRSSSGRNSYHKTNTGAEIVKVVLGGFLAIPIAYLLVLWVFQQDPLGVGPTIGKSMPFAVPEQFRVEEEIEPRAADTDDDEKSETEPEREQPIDVSEQPEESDVNPLDLGELPKPNLDPAEISN